MNKQTVKFIDIGWPDPWPEEKDFPVDEELLRSYVYGTLQGHACKSVMLAISHYSNWGEAFSRMDRERDDQFHSEIVLQAIVRVDRQDFVKVCDVSWLNIWRSIKADPEFINRFARHPRKFEEFLAATYDKLGFDEVTLTPASGDGGRDVIAVKHGFGSIRILEQAKAYSPGHLVTHDDIRAMLGVLQTDPNSSKAIITTTSDFQPGIFTGPEFKPFMPHRLETKNGKQLIEWLKGIEEQQQD